MPKKIINGKCKVCGENIKLSYEHTPPKRAFNWWKQKIYFGEELIKHIQSDNYPWDVSDIKGKELQKGVGGHTLCVECNNNTGSWYVPSFVEFSKQAMKSLIENKPTSNSIKIKFRGINPLAIMKQIICMFLSINNPNFSDIHPELRRFILDKESKISLKDIQIYAYFNMGVVLRNIGIAGILFPEKGYSRTVSELTTLPFGFVMEIKPPIKEKTLTNISHFSEKYNHDDRVDLELSFPLLQSNSYLPMDYRSMKEIKQNRSENEHRGIHK